MKRFDMNIVAERLKILRQERNIGQNRLADEIGVSNASISYWENAKQLPSIEALFKLSVYYEVPCDYILGLIDD